VLEGFHADTLADIVASCVVVPTTSLRMRLLPASATYRQTTEDGDAAVPVVGLDDEDECADGSITTTKPDGRRKRAPVSISMVAAVVPVAVVAPNDDDKIGGER